MKNRSLGDNAQKHKIHHVLYIIVASAIYKGAVVFYDFLGIPFHHASYSVNALLTVSNIVLLYVLLRYFGLDHSGQMMLLLVFYAFSLSTWIFASVPESWTFSATLALFFLVLHYRLGVNPFLLSLFLGIAMLNNVFLASLILFPSIHLLDTCNSLARVLTKATSFVLITLSTWTLALYGLSFFDVSFRPDRFIAYTLWFKEFLGYRPPWYDPYVWKTIIAGLFFNSILTNQSDPVIPPEALRDTLMGSLLGSISLAIYLMLSLVVISKIAQMISSKFRCSEGLLGLLKEKESPLILYCVTWIVLTFMMNPPAGFLYSTMIVPLIVLLIYRFTDMERRFHRALLYATVLAILLNNSLQVMKFREILLSN